eukprot:GHVU01143359.1.p1 GENE.GHVU01143359.1~~GHVU01143359.1.p1  ORF type:complete len:103 (-),score=2.66 GHVU01143359.1:168-476(-)
MNTTRNTMNESSQEIWLGFFFLANSFGLRDGWSSPRTRRGKGGKEYSVNSVSKGFLRNAQIVYKFLKQSLKVSKAFRQLLISQTATGHGRQISSLRLRIVLS